MMRRPRHETTGGTYHVYNRGNDGLVVFRDDDDRSAFVAHLSTLSRLLGWSVLTYCVLGTHFHLLVRTTDPNLGEGMRDLMGRAAVALHTRYGTRGRVWEDRYKAKVVLDQTYLEHLFRYIALNPVHAGLCSEPGGWRRSPHRALAAGASDGVVDLHAVEQALGRGAYPHLFDELGRHGSWSTAVSPELPRPPLEDVLASVTDVSTAMRRARFTFRYKLDEIARATGVSTSTVSRRTGRPG